MPKILPRLREQLIDAARRQIEKSGYANTTIRSVAGECGVGVGTVYNYFPSKDMLIAAFMLEDWQLCLARMQEVSAADPAALLLCIHKELCDFSRKHSALFRDADASKVFIGAFSERHRQLRSQLSAIILPVCPPNPGKERAFLAEFIAESLLSWTMSETDPDVFLPILLKLLK